MQQFIVVYRPQRALMMETQFHGPFDDLGAADDFLCTLPALGSNTTGQQSGVKWIEKLTSAGHPYQAVKGNPIMTDDNETSLLENVAAISCDLHTDRRYAGFYEAQADKLGGFIGIYGLCIDMAKALSEYEIAQGGASEFYSGEHSDKMDWVELIEAFVDETLKAPDIDTKASLARALARFTVK